jgi:hypothetical protein
LASCIVAAVGICASPHVLSADTNSGVTISWDRAKAGSANAAIMAYLGEPVPPPARLDPKYTVEGLTAAFTTLCKKIGSDVIKLGVDDTEFPFLVYGVITGERPFQDIQNALRAMPGYAYSGSVVGSSNGTTYFSLNMVPRDQYPPEQAEAIRRRNMIRLQMLGAVWPTR